LIEVVDDSKTDLQYRTSRLFTSATVSAEAGMPPKNSSVPVNDDWTVLLRPTNSTGSIVVDGVFVVRCVQAGPTLKAALADVSIKAAHSRQQMLDPPLLLLRAGALSQIYYR
jgi:hypothetical protein